jgi:protein O-mannosyl-transferase
MSSRAAKKAVERARRASRATRPPRAVRQPALTDRTTLFHLLFLSAATFGLYARTLRNGFVIDDNYEVLQDRFIRSLANIPSMFLHNVWFFAGAKVNNYYRPLKLLAYSLEYHLFGFRAAYWHFANVLLYLAAAITMYFLVRGLTLALPVPGGPANGVAGESISVTDLAGLKARAKLAFWTALFFVFHPTHVEAVAWIAAGNDLLCGLALLLALYFYHRARIATRPLLAYAASLLFFLAGLFSKETALTFPAVVLAYDFFYRRESVSRMWHAWRRYLAYLGVLVGYLALRVYALSGFAPAANPVRLTSGQMVMSVPALAVKYLWKALVPVNLNFWYMYQPVLRLGWQPVGAIALCLFLVSAMFWLRRHQPLLSFALAWFWLTLIPVLDIPKISVTIFADRYSYIPSFGFCIFFAWACLWLRDHSSRPVLHRAAYASLLALFVFYARVVFARVPDWRDDFRMATKTARQSPNAAPVQADLGLIYDRMGRFDEALQHVGRAVAIDPGNPAFRNNLASLFISRDRYDDALPQLEKATQLAPSFPPSWLNLSTVYNARKEWAESIEACQRGLAIDPNNPREPYNYLLLAQLSLALWNSGQRDQALATLRRAIQLDPDRLEARFYLAISMAATDQYDTATDQLLAALRSDPHSPDAYLAHYELGGIYQIKQRWQDAEREYQLALSENPGYTPARLQLQAVRSLHLNPQR